MKDAHNIHAEHVCACGHAAKLHDPDCRMTACNCAGFTRTMPMIQGVPPRCPGKCWCGGLLAQNGYCQQGHAVIPAGAVDARRCASCDGTGNTPAMEADGTMAELPCIMCKGTGTAHFYTLRT